MIIEGPIVTIIAAFLASLGTLNIFIVYVLGVFGNIIADSIYYAIGRFGRKRFLVRYGKYIGITPDDIQNMEHHYEKHLLKTIVIAKATEAPVIPTLISAGIAEADFSKFIVICSFSEIVKVAIIACVGYFFGQFYVTINTYFKEFVGIGSILLVVLLLSFVIYKI